MADKIDYTIEEVSLRTGISKHTLRYWEKEFEKFLAPSRTKGGHRRYNEEAIEVILRIRNLLKERLYSIAGARRALESLPVRGMEDHSLVNLEDRVAEKIVSLVQGKLLGVPPGKMGNNHRGSRQNTECKVK